MIEGVLINILWPLVGLIFAIAMGYFVAKALKVKSVSAIIAQANETIQLYGSRIDILEKDLNDLKTQYESATGTIKKLEDLVLQREDFKELHKKLDKLLKDRLE